MILGEDKADLEALTADYYQRFAPATPEERCLVDIVIRSEWQLRRLSAVEAELWEHQMEPLPQEGCLRGHAFSLSARLQRRIDAAERSFYRALHELERRESREIPEAETHPGSNRLKKCRLPLKLASFRNRPKWGRPFGLPPPFWAARNLTEARKRRRRRTNPPRAQHSEAPAPNSLCRLYARTRRTTRYPQTLLEP